ncbi:hypothetical protein BH23VER1_BH23VER1_28130 [soil metagenome]
MIVSPFSKDFDRRHFQSGEPALDRYLQVQVSQDLRANIAACYILHEQGSKETMGYYTLSAFSIMLTNIPSDQAKKLPRYPHVPVTLLGRLAVSRDLQGKGWGKMLVIDALRKAATARSSIGSWAVVVDPLNASAAHFYSKFGFRPCRGDSSEDARMLLTMRDIEKNLGTG